MAIASTSSFGHLLKRLRTRVGMTQEELADAAGMSVRTISDLQRRVNQNARRDTIYLLANALKLSDTDRRDFEWVARRPNLIAGTPQPPWTLPRDISAFTDRGDELRVLGTAAKGAEDSAIYTIGGMAGIGKTTLAVRAAHMLAPRFPDGQIFLSLHAHTPGHDPVDPVDALGSLLQAIGSSADRIPASLEDRASQWRDRLNGKKVLLVLDDAADSDQVLPLMPGSTGNLTLVTSRKRLHALEGAITPASATNSGRPMHSENSVPYSGPAATLRTSAQASVRRLNSTGNSMTDSVKPMPSPPPRLADAGWRREH